MQYTTEALVEILSNHAAWLKGEGGKRANLVVADLSRANLHGAYLRLANLRRAILIDADLVLANLRDANLHYALLTDANLTGANLSDADLSDADLSLTKLRGANLTRAILHGADLTGADLTGADLTRATGVVDLGCPDGWRAVGWWKDGEPWVRVGCRTMSLADARDYWAEKDNRREVMAALDYFEAVAAVRAENPKTEAA